MTGRAGRPQFDSFGVAVIMTSQEDREYYENHADTMEIVESTLQSALVEVQYD